jgi:ferredoxin
MRLHSLSKADPIRPSTASRRTTVTARREPRPQNVEGDLYVDETCIDCDCCRWMASSTFSRVEGASAVTTQPATAETRREALRALISCPTFSIHSRGAEAGELAAAHEDFPLLVPGCREVHLLGHTNEKAYGAMSYFIRRADGNVMVDVPRWSPSLAKQLERCGGVQYIFLTHRDDVADHDTWAERFDSKRIIHLLEADRRQGTE